MISSVCMISGENIWEKGGRYDEEQERIIFMEKKFIDDAYRGADDWDDNGMRRIQIGYGMRRHGGGNGSARSQL